LPDLSKKRERDRLAVARNPYFMKLGKGAYLGFRRGPDTWHARFRDKKKKQHSKALEEFRPNDYDGAKKAAEAWFEQMGAPATRAIKRDTVRLALDAYLADLLRHGRTAAATDATGRFKQIVHPDAIADLSLEAATKDDFLEFRDRLRKGRQPRSVNRHFRSIAAGLNRATELGHVGNPAAWRLKPLADDVDDDGETAVFLSPEHRRALIAAAESRAAEFFRGMELTGARPRELAEATARDFNGSTLRLAHRKGRPPKLRVRYTVLGPDAIEFFAMMAADKLPSAWLFTEDGSTPWRRHYWGRAFRRAFKAVNKSARGSARIPAGASSYGFRHARISELLQVHGVDPLTVAHQTGTSLVMIERAYLRFIPQALQEKLASLKERA